MTEEPPPRNYYSDQSETADGLKYRLGGEDIIRTVVNMFRGATYDERGIFKGLDPNKALMNEIGIYNLEVLFQSCVNKVSSLSNYQNEERINRQIRELFNGFLFDLTLNIKVWNVKNKDSILMQVEYIIYNNILRANKGFENLNISRIHQVLERIGGNDEPQEQKKSVFGMFRGGNRGNY